MKTYRILTACLALMLSLSILLSACGNGAGNLGSQQSSSTTLSSSKGSINVAVQPGLGFTVEGSSRVSVDPGKDVSFTIRPKEGFKIIGFSHSDYLAGENGVYVFKNILYPTVIEVYFASTQGGTGSSVTGTTSPVTTTRPVTTAPDDTDPPVTDSSVSGTTTPETGSDTPATTTKKEQDTPVIDGPTNDIAYADSIIYCFNGGVYKGAEDVHEMTVFPSTEHHQRVNVINGKDTLSREGYTLIGWNTAPDGRGTHVSLGSRCTLNKKGALMLYAHWVKWSDAENFTYDVKSGKAHITSYSANEDVLSIPAELGGYPVTTICTGAFENIGCTRVILPSCIETVEDKAFENCALTTLHFYDTVVSVSDTSFNNCKSFSTIYINQLKAPVYITGNGKVEAYDSLILCERKAIVFFAGSSVLYGIDAYRADASFEDTEYDVINLGWTAPRNAIFQVQIITALLDKGDIFIHAPEYISSYHLMRSITMGSTAWQIIDCNLDLFSYVDIRTVPKVLSSFCSFTKAKSSSSKTYTYNDYCKSMDLLGYKCSNRPIIHDADWAPDGSCKIQASLITDTSITRLRELYSAIEKKGAKVYLSYPPLNQNYIHESSRDPQVRQGYVDRLESIGYTVIGSPEDFFYDGTHFHDTEFHLVTFAAQKHTDKIVGMLKEQMRDDGLLK